MLKLKNKKRVKKVLRRAHSPVRWIWPKMSDALIGIFCFFLIIFALLTYSTRLSEYTSKLVTGNKYLSLLDGFFNPFRNKHLLLKSGLPIYDLKIKHQRYAIIEDVIKKAKKQGWMSDDLKVWANAQFIHDGEMYNVKVRVRGDLPRHWSGPKRSYRIKFGKRKIIGVDGQVREEPIYFNRTRQINLIVPIDREFILAKFINELMQERGVLVPRDDFVILRINGVIQGLYYQVEHFDKPLMAFRRRPETTVFAQNDRAKHFEQYTKYGTPATSDANFEMGTLRRLIDRNGELGMQAMKVLFEFVQDPRPEKFRRARAVLDWEKYLTFRVITTLCNTNHVRFGTDNLRLYYDPSRGLLEPIPWDAHLLRMPKEPGTIDFWNNKGPDALQRATLLDPELRLQRNRILWSFIGDGGDSLMAKYTKLHDKIRPFAWADVLTTPIQGHKMDQHKKNFDYNVRRAFKVLNNSNCNFTYRLEAPDRAALEMNLLNFSGVEWQSVQLRDSLLFVGRYDLYEDQNDNGQLDAEDPLVATQNADHDWSIRFEIGKRVFPHLEYRGDFIAGRYWEFFDTKTKRARYFLVGKLAPENRHPIVWSPPEIAVAAKNLVTDYQIPSAFISQQQPLPDNMTGITAYDDSDPFDLDAQFYTREAFLAKHPPFVASKESEGVELRGAIEISESVIIPKGVPLLIRPGADITLKPGANILIYSGLTCIGTPQDRIRIHGDESGFPFGSVAVVRPQAKVVVRYTDFSDGGQAQINGILFTGGFAVHEGDLELEHCTFDKMQSEDGLNLKNGHIVMRHCRFTANDSDAVDIDFGTGIVENCEFRNIHGDGLDISGSTLQVSSCVFENVVDKGFSVGENSSPTIINSLFKGCDIGISAKDLSFVRAANCTFVENRLAIEAKRKKPMFGGGSGEVVNCVFSGNQELLTEDYFSKGRMIIKSSLSDVTTDWEASRTAKIQFLAPEQNNYVLHSQSMPSDGFAMTYPEWLSGQGNGFSLQQPGIYSLSTNR
ncbi:MAG: right-handed parallel beta-helix repeat-containing protein [bacterium]